MSINTLKTKVEQLIKKVEDFPELFEYGTANYTRPSWWLPYPELTSGENINEIFLLMEVLPDVMEYDGIDLSNTSVLKNGKKQFWKRLEGTQIDGEQPDLIEVYANCCEQWCFNHTALTVTTALTSAKSFYPKLQLIGGTAMKISSTSNHLPASGNLRLITCPINITTSVAGIFSYCGLLRAPLTIAQDSTNYIYNACTSMTDGGILGGSAVGSGGFLYQFCLSLEKIHIAQPCSMVSNTLNKCSNLKYVTVDSGFTQSLYLQHSTRYTSQTLHTIIESYADCAHLSSAPKFSVGAENIEKIDDEHIEMLNVKGIDYE